MVSDLDSKSQLALYIKRGNVLIVNFTIYLEKREFL